MSKLKMSARWACGMALMLAALGGTAHAAPHMPEIDPSSMAGALTLLSGGVLLITGRRRAK